MRYIHRLPPITLGALAIGLAGVLYGCDARAQVAPYGPRMVALPPDAACLARVEAHNLFGVYNAVETVQTEVGAVSVRYETVGNHAPGHDDVVEVVGLPDGIYAVPMQATVKDGAVLTLCLIEWTGL